MKCIVFICGIAAVCIFAVFLLPPIPQDPSYHDFADKRAWLGIPNFGDVAGNLLFILIGIAGGASVWRMRAALDGGIGSVCYWNWTENAGHGDLRFYVLVQFLPMILMLLILALFRARHGGTRYLIYTFGWYILAKALEYFDPDVFNLTNGIVSGHTLKHIAAAIGAGCTIGYVRCLAKGAEKKVISNP